MINSEKIVSGLRSISSAELSELIQNNPDILEKLSLVIEGIKKQSDGILSEEFSDKIVSNGSNIDEVFLDKDVIEKYLNDDVNYWKNELSKLSVSSNNFFENFNGQIFDEFFEKGFRKFIDEITFYKYRRISEVLKNSDNRIDFIIRMLKNGGFVYPEFYDYTESYVYTFKIFDSDVLNSIFTSSSNYGKIFYNIVVFIDLIRKKQGFTDENLKKLNMFFKDNYLSFFTSLKSENEYENYFKGIVMKVKV